MDELISWLRTSRETPLVRSALVRLNLMAIHPFNDGNGRTARILAAMELVRDGVRAPELVSIEAYLRRNPRRVHRRTANDPRTHLRP